MRFKSARYLFPLSTPSPTLWGDNRVYIQIRAAERARRETAVMIVDGEKERENGREKEKVSKKANRAERQKKKRDQKEPEGKGVTVGE